MTGHNRGYFKFSAVAVIVVVCVAVLRADVPHGWHLAGLAPDKFETGIDTDQQNQGHPSAYLKSTQLRVDGFGTLMQSINSQLYKGKRIRLSGLVKSEEVTGWAGLWMRVDQETSAVAFDNMQNRPIKGTTGWHRYEVVLNVAPDSTAISFGILLSGTGEVWLNSAKLEIVGLDTPLSSSEQKANDRPVNLDFAQ